MTRTQGRPAGSAIRQNIVEILHLMQKAYAYEIYKIYVEIFPKVTMRSVYHHLKRGVSTGEFVVSDVTQEKGDFSWGPIVEKTYYSLGNLAKPLGNSKLDAYFEKKQNKL